MVYRILAVVILSAAVCTMSLEAQPTKKKDEGSVEIFKNDAGKWRYRIKGADGKTIAMPLPQMHWDTKKDVLKAVEELKDLLNSTKPVEVKDEPTKKADDKKDTKKEPK